MIQYIAHRINTLEQLQQVPLKYGIELDIRYHENLLVLHHDPFHHHETPKPCEFETILKNWKHDGPMILNVKTEGIELECINLMEKYKVKKWFFLDLSMPYFAIYAEKAFKNEIKGFTADNLAVRFSEREPVEYALAFQNKARWVWVDCFTEMPLNQENYNKLKQAGYKICIVSPELQHHSIERIDEFKEKLKNMQIDAVCTKRIDLWEE